MQAEKGVLVLQAKDDLRDAASKESIWNKLEQSVHSMLQDLNRITPFRQTSSVLRGEAGTAATRECIH